MRRSGIRTTGYLLLALLFSFTTHEFPAMAAGKSSDRSVKAPKKRKKVKESGLKEPVADAEDSAAGADDKTKGSRTEVLGNLSPSPLLAFGLTVGKIKGDNSGLEGNFTYANGKSGTVLVKMTHIGGRYRKPIMKIGYVAGGAGLRMASGSWTVLNTDGSNEYPAGSSYNAITLDGAVGGIMQFGSILVGADLLGISFPLFKMGAKSTEPDAPDVDTADADNQKAAFNKAAGGMTMTLLKFGVGIYF